MIFEDESSARHRIMSYYPDGTKILQSYVSTQLYNSDHWVMFADPYVHLSLLRMLNVNVLMQCLQRYLLIRCVREFSVMYVRNSHVATKLIEIMPYLAITLRAPTSRATRTRTLSAHTGLWYNLEMRYSVSVQPSRGFFSSQNHNIQTVKLKPGNCVVLPQCTLLCNFLSGCEILLLYPECWGEYGQLSSNTALASPEQNAPKRTEARTQTKAITNIEFAEIMKTIERTMTPFDHKIFLMRNIVPIENIRTAIQESCTCTDDELSHLMHIMFCDVNHKDEYTDNSAVQIETTHLMPRSAILQEDCSDNDTPSKKKRTSSEQKVAHTTTTLCTFYHRLELLARLAFCSESYMAQHQTMIGPLLHQLYLPIGREQLLNSIDTTKIEQPAALPFRFSTRTTKSMTIVVRQSCSITLHAALSFEAITKQLDDCIEHMSIVNLCNSAVAITECLIPKRAVLSETEIRFIHLVIILLIIRACPIVSIDEIISLAIFVTTRLLCDNRTFHVSCFIKIHDYHAKCRDEFWASQKSTQSAQYPEKDITKLVF